MESDSKFGFLNVGVSTSVMWFDLRNDESLLQGCWRALRDIREHTTENMVSNVKAHFVSDWKSQRLTPYLGELMSVMLDCCYKYSINVFNVDLKKLNFQLTVSDIWVADYIDGDHTVLHNHYPSDFSCIFYLDVEEAGSPLVLNDTIEVHPHSGTLVVFPGHLNHSVRPTKGRRIVIPANIHKIPHF